MLLLPGEIKLAEQPVLSVEKSQELGAHLVELLAQKQYKGQYRIHVRPEREAGDDQSGLVARGKYADLLDELLECYLERLEPSPITPSIYGHFLIYGADGEIIPWHTDTPGDIRFMQNLGLVDASVEIGTVWDPSIYISGVPWDDDIPDEYETLTFEPGQFYGSNALVTDSELLVPHQTVSQPGRIVLRTSIYPTDGWEDLAVSGGVPVEIG